MLNAPSSASRFAKPIKQCFVAPEGFVIGAIDFASLEDRVMANLSRDENKLNVFLKGVDGHSLAALYYWPQAAQEVLQDITDTTEAALRFKAVMDGGNVILKDLRNRGKRISFGLAYGAFPKKVSVSAKIPLEEAESIFKAYHEELYPGVTAYRENYVLKSARENGFIHMGLGARIYTDSPDKDIRTLTNSTCQFWSILSLLTINKLHQLIDEAGYQNDIIITSSIYDSIYFCIRDDAKIIKWLNDVIVPVMETKYMAGQILDNSVDLEIGPDWYELYKLPHNAPVEEISAIRTKW